MKNIRFAFSSFLLLSWSVSSAFAQNAIVDFHSLNLSGVSITTNEEISDGTLNLPEINQTYNELPSFQRVALTSRPTPQSNIKIEVWMPKNNWNGRFLGTGNGGGAGSINYGALLSGLKRGFAVANTDMGTSPYANDVIEYPERWKDFGYRATHEMTVIAKAIIEKYYQRLPSYSYFTGCSTGGQQSLMEAQRYPEDYNGIIAGAPANNRTHLHALFLWNYKVMNGDCNCAFTPEQLQRITEIIIETNTGKDGGVSSDNFLTDPRMATLDYSLLNSILTDGQIKALKKVFSGPVNPQTGEQIYTAFPLGSESQGLGLGYQQDISVTQGQFYQYLWIWGKEFDYSTFDFNKDMDKMDAVLAPILNANNPDLKAFKKSGGKLLMYTGTADPIVPFQDAIHYYERVIEEQGSLEETQKFFRYFLIPGMAHCGGGPGLNDFGQSISNASTDNNHDLLTALINWVEKEEAPYELIGTSYNDEGIRLQRPVFPYPEFPEYIGGDPSSPSSFKASVHERGNVIIPAEKYLK